ncbi:MAG: DnaD domain protein [Clostridia bacterium]|nr:DnaD domain protein [Clostridia bacterium]
MTCSLSKEFSISSITSVENEFITKYLPLADGNAVKVYLYGLYLCSHPEFDKSINEIALDLSLTEDIVRACFLYWQQEGLVDILCNDPLQVVYYSPKSAFVVKPKKYKPEKYSEFTKAVQEVLPNRMISTNEYTEYFNFMETYGIKPDAMLLIIKYCVELKGADINYKYINATAKNFASKGLIKLEQIQDELSSYFVHSTQIANILSALSISRKPDIEDKQLFDKWTDELSFEYENILFAAKTLKKGSIKKLDDFILELYSLKCFSKEEIEEYSLKKKQVYDLTLRINKALSIYVDVIAPEIDNFVSKWITFGFDDQTLLLIANYCFKTGKNTLQQMDELVNKLKDGGSITFSSVGDFFESQKKNDEFIKKFLSILGLTRNPTPWDRDNLHIWKSWNFSDEMIVKAAELSAGKTSAVAYMNSILSNWKNKGLFNVSETENLSSSTNSQEEYNREYERRRTIALSKSQKNIEKAMEIDGFSKLYERTFSIEKDLAVAEVSENDELLKTLEIEKQNLLEKIENMLSKFNLTFRDLSPRYMCEKCNDTGYVGTHRCDCFDKK